MITSRWSVANRLEISRADSSSFNSSQSSKPTVKVRTGCVISSDINATFADESTPPERKTPKGTSAIMRFLIESRSSLRVFQNGFYLGRKYDPPVMVMEVKRLAPGAVARQHQAFTICVPERNRIIAFDLMNEIESQFF